MHINWIGVATLTHREISRFLKVWNQTVVAPMITTLLFLAILTLAMGGSTRMVGDIPYPLFIAPGLIMMAVVQNAFANTSSSLMLMKIQGVIVDILMPPLTGGEITLAFVLGGLVRGLAVGITVSAAMYIFVPFTIVHFWVGAYYLITASVMLALFGVLAGVWSQSFDQLAALTNYIVTPLAFLSGTFYSIRHLPEFWYNVCHFNPFFYMIDGFRYALTGYADGNLQLGMAVMLAANFALYVAIVHLFKSGYRLKS